MKTPVFCRLLFVGVISISQAEELQPPAKATPKIDQPAVQSSPSRVHNFANDMFTNRTETVCEYLRVYRVRRPYSDSDIVVPSGYTECVPSKGSGLKSAVETRTVPRVGKTVADVGK
jgi:hypothetical protein